MREAPGEGRIPKTVEPKYHLTRLDTMELLLYDFVIAGGTNAMTE